MDKIKEDLKKRAREHLFLTIMCNPLNVIKERITSSVDGVVEMIARELQEEIDRERFERERRSGLHQ